MELDRNYFNQIRLNTRRGKFYDIEAVDRLLVDIRSRADSMNREYAAACQKLAEALQTVESLREENTELFMKGQALSQEVLALRDELKAAQSGEAFVIPEEESSLSQDESRSSEEPGTEQKEGEDLSSSLSPDPYSLTPDSPLMPPDIVTSSTRPAATNLIQSEVSASDESSIINSPASAPQEADSSVISSCSPREEADKILASAYAEAASIRNSAQQLWDSTVSRLDSVFSMIREINTYSIEKTDRIRQEFLDSLPEEEAVPPDVTEKVGLIAQQLSEIEENEE